MEKFSQRKQNFLDCKKVVVEIGVVFYYVLCSYCHNTMWYFGHFMVKFQSHLAARWLICLFWFRAKIGWRALGFDISDVSWSSASAYTRFKSKQTIFGHFWKVFTTNSSHFRIIASFLRDLVMITIINGNNYWLFFLTCKLSDFELSCRISLATLPIDSFRRHRKKKILFTWFLAKNQVYKPHCA